MNYQILESRRPRRPPEFYREWWDDVDEERLRFFNAFAYFIEDNSPQSHIKRKNVNRYMAAYRTNYKHLKNFRRNTGNEEFVELFQLVSLGRIKSFLESDWNILINGDDYYVISTHTTMPDLLLERKKIIDYQFYRLRNAMKKLEYEIRYGDLS